MNQESLTSLKGYQQISEEEKEELIKKIYTEYEREDELSYKKSKSLCWKLSAISAAIFIGILIFISVRQIYISPKEHIQDEYLPPNVRKAFHKVPVIFDTDIGSDIDDMWALSYLLQSNDFDVKYIMTDGNESLMKAKVLAKFLTEVNRTEIPIAVGVKKSTLLNSNCAGYFRNWTDGFNMGEEYAGVIYYNPITAFRSIVNAYEDGEVVLISTSPASNLKKILTQGNSIKKLRAVITMGGSFKYGLGGRVPPIPETNIHDDITAAKTLYGKRKLQRYMAPLDVAGIFQISGIEYERLLDSDNKYVTVLLDVYRGWVTQCEWANEGQFPSDPLVRTSTLYDLVAVGAFLPLFVKKDLDNNDKTDLFKPYLEVTLGEVHIDEEGMTTILQQEETKEKEMKLSFENAESRIKEKTNIKPDKEDHKWSAINTHISLKWVSDQRMDDFTKHVVDVLTS